MADEQADTTKDTTTKDLTTATDVKQSTTDTTDAKALNDGSGVGAETPKEAAKDPAGDAAVAGPKMFSGMNTPASSVDPLKGSMAQSLAAADITPHKITGVDVTQPPALDLDTGLARTTLFEKEDD